jgi:hypothetical protein
MRLPLNVAEQEAVKRRACLAFPLGIHHPTS